MTNHEPAIIGLRYIFEDSVISHPFVEVVLYQATVLKAGVERYVMGTISIAMAERHIEGAGKCRITDRRSEAAIVINVRL